MHHILKTLINHYDYSGISATVLKDKNKFVYEKNDKAIRYKLIDYL